MLDAFIIEEIKRREREQSRDDRPVVELPVPAPPRDDDRRDDRDDRDKRDRPDRGVVIIDYAG
jgi:hypothetical protein